MTITKQELLDQLYTRREAEQYLGITPMNMQYHLKNNNIKTAKEFGKGNAKVQLFSKADLDRIPRKG